MAFSRKLLNEGEEVVLDLRPHWWVLAQPAMATVVALAAVAVVAVLDLAEFLLWLALLLTAAALVWLALRWIKRSTTNFVLTTDRLIYRAGVLAKKGMEIPLERVNNIAFSQTVFERMLRSGDLVIESAGEQGHQPFSNIARPSQVQNEIYRQMELAAARDAERISGRRELSIPEQLDKLDQLRQRGVISQAEFDVKKAQLLERM